MGVRGLVIRGRELVVRVDGGTAGSGDPAQGQQTQEIEGQRVPERGGLHLFQTADSELVQAAVAAFGVGELGDRRALFVKLGSPPFVLKIVFCERYGARSLDVVKT